VQQKSEARIQTCLGDHKLRRDLRLANTAIAINSHLCSYKECLPTWANAGGSFNEQTEIQELELACTELKK
jgi:hypothetical protein